MLFIETVLSASPISASVWMAREHIGKVCVSHLIQAYDFLQKVGFRHIPSFKAERPDGTFLITADEFKASPKGPMYSYKKETLQMHSNYLKFHCFGDQTIMMFFIFPVKL